MTQDERLRFLVMFGGCSTEYGVSLQSARAVLEHMDRTLFTPVMAGITRAGAWQLYTGPLERIEDGSWAQDAEHCAPCVLPADRTRRALLLPETGEWVEFDVAFPVLHGKNGEDGTVQGLLELAGIPIVGCGTLSSALCMDKDRSHKLAAAQGVLVPRSAVFSRGADEAAIAEEAERLGWPLFVKPVRSGSSYGVNRVESREQLLPAVEEAFSHDSRVILEEAVPGFEVGCAVMGGDTLFTGEVDEIELSQGFFDFEEKYSLKTSAIHCPARISPDKAREIRRMAQVIYRALDCRVFARVDLFLTPQGQIVFNEVNTIPGFTSHSRYPTMMAKAGLSFRELITRLICLGVEA